MQLRWSREAADDLARIVTHIRKDDPEAARAVGRALFDGVGRLRDFPNSGRLGREEGTRELVYPGLPFLAVYQVRGELVEVLTILHARQSWPR